MKKGLLALMLLNPLIGACNGVFYHPLREDIYDPRDWKLTFSQERIAVDSEVELAAFWFKPQGRAQHKKIVVHFHGNAENMTSHFIYTAWLSLQGFDVLTFDYRGYGRSSAVAPTREGLIADGCAVLHWVQSHPLLQTYDIAVIGQSLGGAVAIRSLATCPVDQVKQLVIDSSFSSYRRIARQKLSSFFLTWPLQVPLSYLVSDEANPIDSISQLRMKMLFLHSKNDPVVPYNLGRELYESAVADKLWVDVPGDGHTAAFGDPGSPYRAQLVQFLLGSH